MNATITPLPAVVDEYTDLQMQAAAIEARLDSLKQILIASGLREVCGSLTRVVISHTPAGFSTSWKDLAMSLDPAPETIARFQKPTDEKYSVRVYGYSRQAPKAKKTTQEVCHA